MVQGRLWKMMDFKAEYGIFVTLMTFSEGNGPLATLLVRSLASDRFRARGA